MEMYSSLTIHVSYSYNSFPIRVGMQILSKTELFSLNLHKTDAVHWIATTFLRFTEFCNGSLNFTVK